MSSRFLRHAEDREPEAPIHPANPASLGPGHAACAAFRDDSVGVSMEPPNGKPRYRFRARHCSRVWPQQSTITLIGGGSMAWRTFVEPRRLATA